MTAQEFSDQFDVLYNNITSNQAPGLTEYEKSIFLTKAQDEIIKNHFLPQTNATQAGFDDNQKRQMDFSNLIVWNNDSGDDLDNPVYDTRTPNKSVTLADNVWIIINERLEVTRNEKKVNLVVKPISYDDYDRLMSKPYKRPLKYQAWRLILSKRFTGTEDTSETGRVIQNDLIVGPTDVITLYSIRYVKRPKPVIVGELDDLTIDGYTFGTSGTKETSGCELNAILHEEVLQRAVELAKVAWTATGQENAQLVLQAGQRSE